MCTDTVPCNFVDLVQWKLHVSEQKSLCISVSISVQWQLEQMWLIATISIEFN